ncbi:hypothetical protein BU25DRAFT_480952 [Macroventuria anomochaeta]|uniref:Uncharacterized protein n=1 Tax=Macroventuria anomochaeta TaxID=301207 RepID=A0ACB6RK22_9PLEO|nr:uncharacterized protein BU25DRAFT_480952 [Macroventuria anomochaeta]KAF2622114.1 hypothetical protein BU25DRAFT_480952 [Macroventuria anomochaeta]
MLFELVIDQPLFDSFVTIPTILIRHVLVISSIELVVRALASTIALPGDTVTERGFLFFTPGLVRENAL